MGIIPESSFVESLLCARHHSRHWQYCDEENGQKSLPSWRDFFLLVGEAGHACNKLVQYRDCWEVVCAMENRAGQRDQKCCLGWVGGLKF